MPSPDIAEGEALGKRIAEIHDVAREARDPCLPAQRRHHRRIRPHLCFRDEPARKDGAENALVMEILVEPEPAASA